ncbi:MAG TPA: hypothetical protein VL242_14990 [Sorangium sp.]|nr:hypothetical protein [Sorangium sp.]
MLPSIDDCATADDEDCDGTTSPCPGTLSWSHGFGDATEQAGAGLAVGASGDIVVIGSTSGPVDFGAGAALHQGGTDVFLASFDASGARRWDRLFGDSESQNGRGVALGRDGGAVIAGNFSGSINFGGMPLSSAGGADIFVAKLNSAGEHTWSRRYGGTNDQQVNGLAIDASDSLAVVGYFAGTMSLAGLCTSMTSAGGYDVFVAKLDPTGICLWSRKAGSLAEEQYGYGVASDREGGVVATGTFNGSADFGTGPKTSAGGTDMFIVKYDSSGVPLWCNTYGDAANQSGYATAVDSTGNVFVIGYFLGSMTFGADELHSEGGYDVFVGKLDGDGVPVWGKRFGGAGDEFGAHVAIDSEDNVVVTGSFAGPMDLGGGALTRSTGSDIFIAKLDGMTGDHLWSHSAGGTYNEFGNAVAVDDLDHTIMTGGFGSDPLNIGGNSLHSRGMNDILLAKYLP